MEKCPWCDSEAVTVNSPIGWFVECKKNGHVHNIGVFGYEHSYRKTEEEAIKEWDEQVKLFNYRK